MGILYVLLCSVWPRYRRRWINASHAKNLFFPAFTVAVVSDRDYNISFIGGREYFISDEITSIKYFFKNLQNPLISLLLVWTWTSDIIYFTRVTTCYIRGFSPAATKHNNMWAPPFAAVAVASTSTFLNVFLINSNWCSKGTRVEGSGRQHRPLNWFPHK